jgi:hypothetical protein
VGRILGGSDLIRSGNLFFSTRIGMGGMIEKAQD